MGSLDGTGIETRSVGDLIRSFKTCDGNYAFLIGAGSSKPAGVDTAGELIGQWREERYEQRDPDADFETWVEDMESDVPEGDEYGFWFKQRYPTREGRRRFIRDLVADAEPTFGHIVLAALMEGEDAYVPHTLTPNFDDLLYDAFYKFFENRPLLIDHNAIVPQFQLTKDRATIIKLHGDYLYDNLQNVNTDTLEENMAEALSRTLQEYGLIVVGYSGRDDSIMNVITDDEFDISDYGVYWCTRDASEFSPNAEALLEKPNTYAVEIEGSESLFQKFYDEMKHEDGFSIPERSDIVDRAEQRAGTLPEKVEASKEMTDDGESGSLDSLRLRYRGDEYRTSGQYEKAIEAYTEALDHDPEDKLAYLHRGLAHEELDQWERAIDDYTAALELDPDYKVAYNNRGNVYNAIGDYEDAIADHDAAVDVDPEYPAAYYNRGCDYLELDEYDAAIEDFDRTIELDPTYLKAYQNRSELQLILGDHSAALDDAERAYELAETMSDTAESLMLVLLARLLEDGAVPDERRDEYRDLCEQEFTTDWSFEELDAWLADADLDDETASQATEIVDRLRDHRS